MSTAASRRYESRPTYPPTGGSVQCGWDNVIANLPQSGQVLSIDGPAALDWDQLIRSVLAVADSAGMRVAVLDFRRHLVSWDQVLKRTSAGELADDPDFAPLATGTLADLVDALPEVPRADAVKIVYGPGAALVEHDVLWYAELPKRYAEQAIAAGRAGNLGQPATGQPGTMRRLFYTDWPLLDRHRDSIAAGINCWIDAQDLTRPTLLSGVSLRRSLADLATRPFRTRPTFNTTSWGGHWAQRTLGHNLDAPNTALGYELIAPESGILIGDETAAVEVPFQLLVSCHPEQLLGALVHARFGTSFPIRFDYLDTVQGGNLSVHCHPRDDYMRDVFGWPYTQHETYYVMIGGEQGQVFLGLRADADLERFHQLAHHADRSGAGFDIDQFIQTFPATPHQLFLIPAGTPHGSGEGNVVLEVSATPYLYSLRFYDWLRRDAEGQPRPIHVDHAFRNLNADRRGADVARELIQQPRPIRQGVGWQESLLGRLPEMFFDVTRLQIQAQQTSTDDTAGRFHVLNVVDGDGASVRTAHGHGHELNYAETIVIPGSVGQYTVTARGTGVTRIVKALVR
jgi:mannose-6-phosphate isomerase class I